MIKALAHSLFTTNVHVQSLDRKAAAHVAFVLATEISQNKITEEDIPKRIKTIDIPLFETGDEVEQRYEDITAINEKIRFLFTNGLSPREISKEVGKTYTRVKNVIKKIKASF